MNTILDHIESMSTTLDIQSMSTIFSVQSISLLYAFGTVDCTVCEYDDDDVQLCKLIINYFERTNNFNCLFQFRNVNTKRAGGLNHR